MIALLVAGAVARYNDDSMRSTASYYIRIARGILLILAALLFTWPCAASARSVLDGLEIVDSDKNSGGEILALSPSCPAAQASLRAGDRITAIGGEKIKNLDDYVKVSKRLKNKKGGVAVAYMRSGASHTVELSLHGSPLQDKWGIVVAPWREAAGKKDAEYWLEDARKQIQKNEHMPEKKLRPVDYGKVLLSLFTSLNQKPDAINTAMLAGRQYDALAGLYYRRGDKKEAVWCLRRALMIYGNGLRNADGIQEMVLVKQGLADLQGALAKMK